MNQTRWQTPVSDAKSLSMVSLVDQGGGLHITLQDLRDPARRRYRFTFEPTPAYVNVLEEYRLSESPPPEGTGWTRTVPDSDWLRELRSREPLLDVHCPGCTHWKIVTEDDVIDVLCPNAPEIVEIEPATPDEPLPGKSRVLYHPQDRKELDKLLAEIKRRGKQDRD